MRKFIALGMLVAISAVAVIARADAHAVVAVLDQTRLVFAALQAL
jgi:hypothetical protein